MIVLTVWEALSQLDRSTEGIIKANTGGSVLEETPYPADEGRWDALVYHTGYEFLSPHRVVSLREIEEYDHSPLHLLLLETIFDRLNNACDLVLATSSFPEARLLEIEPLLGFG